MISFAIGWLVLESVWTTDALLDYHRDMLLQGERGALLLLLWQNFGLLLKFWRRPNHSLFKWHCHIHALLHIRSNLVCVHTVVKEALIISCSVLGRGLLRGGLPFNIHFLICPAWQRRASWNALIALNYRGEIPFLEIGLPTFWVQGTQSLMDAALGWPCQFINLELVLENTGHEK